LNEVHEQVAGLFYLNHVGGIVEPHQFLVWRANAREPLCHDNRRGRFVVAACENNNRASKICDIREIHRAEAIYEVLPRLAQPPWQASLFATVNQDSSPFGIPSESEPTQVGIRSRKPGLRQGLCGKFHQIDPEARPAHLRKRRTDTAIATD
jgi:hypothetical protein